MEKNAQKKLPLYQQVAQELEQKITSGEFLPGDRLPSERELIESYGVSRITARLAMGVLEKKGLSHSMQGKGSFVPQESLRQDLLRLTNFQELLKQGGYEARTQPLPEDLLMEGESPVQAGYGILNILGYADAVPVVCYHSRIADTLIGRFRAEGEKMVAAQLPFSTFDLFKRLQVPIGKVEQTLRAVAAGQELAMLLQLAPGSPLIQLRTQVYSPRGDLLEKKTAHYRATYYSFHFTREISDYSPK